MGIRTTVGTFTGTLCCGARVAKLLPGVIRLGELHAFLVEGVLIPLGVCVFLSGGVNFSSVIVRARCRDFKLSS